MMLFTHLIKTVVHSFFRIALAIVLFGAIGIGVSLLVAYQATHVWPPTILTDVISGTIGVLLAYAAGLSVLVREAIGGVFTAEHDIAGDVKRVVEAPVRHR
jgi:uncharacterized protein YacL